MNIAELGIRINSEDASGAAADLDKLTAAGGRAQKATEQLAGSAKKANQALGKQREELSDLLGEIDPTVKALNRLDELESKLAKQNKLGNLDPAIFSDYQSKIQQSRDSLSRFDDALTRTGNTAKQNAAALRGVPAQFTDIAVSLQGGQAPLTVFLQQGGQLKDMFGGIGPAARAMGGYILGLINPLTLAAGGAAALAYGFAAGRQEAVEYNKSLILTGGYAGVTADQLSTMASQVSAVVGTTGAASAALATLAGGGKIASGSFVEVAEAAVAMEKATGKSVGETIAEFNKIAEDPVAAAKELDDQYHFLTASVYAQVVALKEQGNTISAAKLLTDTYADTIQSRTGEISENLGIVERSWNAVKVATSRAIDGLKEVGREASLSDQIEDAERRLKIAESGGFDFLGRNKAAANAIREQLDMLRSRRDAEADIAGYDKQQLDTQDKAKKAIQEIDKLTASSLSNEEKRNNALGTYRKQLEDIRRANPNDSRLSAAAVAKNEQAIRDQFKDPAARTRRSAVNLTDFNDEQNARKALVSSYANSQKELEAQQRAGVISQEAYYRQRVVLINAEKEQVTAAYQDEITALEQIRDRATTSGEQRIQLDQRIADARANMVKAQKDADSELSVLALNEQGRLKKQEESVRTYTDALQQQVRTLRDQGQRSAATLGMGDRQRSLFDSQNAITDRINSSRLELANQYGDGSRGMSIEEYQRKLDALKSTENDLRATVVANYDDMSRAQGDWRNGVTAALQDYQDSARNIAGQTKSLVTGAFGSMEDAAVNFAMTGKASFSDFTKSVIADMARIAVRSASSQALSGLLSIAGSVASSYFGGGASSSAGATQAGYTGTDFSTWVAGQRATGGPVSAGSLYQVNEMGPELLSQGGKSYLMMGEKGGSITPLNSGSLIANTPGVATMGGSSNQVSTPATINVPIQVMGTADEATLQRIERAAEQGARAGYQLAYQDVKKNGPLMQTIRKNR